MSQGPRNVEGERPTRTARETVDRLREKRSEQQGAANRKRTATEASRVAARNELPRNERGEAPTRSARETADRLREKMAQQHGSANRERTSAKMRRA